MELLLHIGPHKTGTTAIQTCFADNASSLRRRGVLYPKCNWAYPAQHRLAFAMKDKVNPMDGCRPDFDAELDALCTALEKSRLPRALISSEEFFAAPIERLTVLKDALPVERVTVLAYPRRPDSFLISCYNQKVKQIGNGFAAPIARFLKEPHKIAPEIDYLRCVTAWAVVFGDDNVAIRPFERGSPLHDVAARLDAVDLVTNATLNQSVPGAVAEMMRLAKLQDMSPLKQRKLFAKASEFFADKPPFSVPDADRRHIIKTFEADNDALFARFGQTNPYKVENFTPTPEAVAQNITVHDLTKLISALL